MHFAWLTKSSPISDRAKITLEMTSGSPQSDGAGKRSQASLPMRDARWLQHLILMPPVPEAGSNSRTSARNARDSRAKESAEGYGRGRHHKVVSRENNIHVLVKRERAVENTHRWATKSSLHRKLQFHAADNLHSAFTHFPPFSSSPLICIHNIYIYVCACVCVCARLYVYVRVCMCACVCEYLCACLFAWICVSALIHAR